MQFSIRSSTVRLGVFISALIISIVVIFQLIWLRKVYRFEEKEFHISVLKAIRGLYEDLDQFNSSNLNQLVETPDPRLYLARLELPVNYDSLRNDLQFELEDFDVYTPCEMGIYSAASRGYMYNTVLPLAGSADKHPASVPALNRNYNYLALFFPNRGKYIFYEMNFWIVSSLILLAALVVCGGSLYFFYRQKSLNEIQRDFVQNFTHEFKTPVATLALAAETLENESIIHRPEKLATYAGIVKYQSGYLNKQIDKLLKYAHTETGRLHLERKPVDMHQVVTDSVTHLAPLIQQKNANLHVNLKAGESLLTGDKDYLVTMVTNLVENAVKYARLPVIRITSFNEPGYFALSVLDNGVGIEKKQLSKLFNKFYRVRHNEEYAAKGFGLGLSFVKIIVRAHRGRISVESIPGKGSNFTVLLPVK